MQKKMAIIVSLVVLVLAGLALLLWRSHIMGPNARTSAGGLMAVNASGTPIPMANAAAAKPDDGTAFQQTNGLLVSLRLNPYPPSMSETAGFEVTLADAQGRALTGASISIDLTMPGMMMPPNKVDLQAAGAGVYQGSGHFTMRGQWRLEVIIDLGNGPQSVFFDVWL